MNSKESIFLTVFTPTYNRAEYLERPYNSLLNQTYKHFEWIIIDDGSSDNTKQVVDEIIKEGKIKVSYHYQENSGKHIAHNRVLQLATGSFLLILDSDDAYKNDALEILVKHWHEIPDQNKKNFIGVTGLCEDQNGKVVGDYFPTSPFDCSSVDKYYKYDIKGEKSGMMKMEILKQYRFPDKKAAYYPEAYVWFAIAIKYKTRYINEVVRIYYIEEKDSIMKPATLMSKNGAEAISEYDLFLINNFLGYSKYQPVAFIKYFIQYTSYASYSGKKFSQIIKPVNGPIAKLIAMLLYPVSLYHRKTRKNLR
jgi:glycosyltransferase involved in cell wall biosynthesis